MLVHVCVNLHLCVFVPVHICLLLHLPAHECLNPAQILVHAKVCA